MGATLFVSPRRRFAVALLIASSLAAVPAVARSEEAPCELVFAEEDRVRESLGLHSGIYRCGAPIVAPRPGFRPVAARRFDFAGDGDADLLIEYAGEEGVQQLLLAVHGETIAAARPAEVSELARVEFLEQELPPPPILLATRLNADGHPELVVALDDGGIAIAEIVLALVVVNSTSETVDFGGAQQIGDLPGPDALVTLREAIIAANNTAGADTVQFNIPSAGNDCHDGACWFTPSDGEAGALPSVLASGGAVTFDGYTQTTNRGDTNASGPELVLEGSGLAGGTGLFFQAATNSAVIDFVISDFPNEGIWAADADALAVSGCYVGVNLTGTIAAPNLGNGIKLVGGTFNAAIGSPGNHGVSPLVPNRNLISGNGAAGISITDAGTDGNNIQANRIGTDRVGTAAIPNDHGVTIEGGASNNGVGGTGAGAGNLISGNASQGVQVHGAGTDATFVQGNQFGTTLNGLAALANISGGVWVQSGATNTLIGGTTVAARNQISGNGNGIDVFDAGTTGTMVQGNWIGVDSSGTAALANTFNGITLHSGTSATTIGGTAAGAGNVISGNTSSGIHLDLSSGNDVLGNRIGTNAAGMAAVGNGNKGVFIVGGSDNDVGDGTVAGRNLISGNGTGAVILDGTAGNRVRGNWIGLDAAGTGAIPNLSIAMVWLMNASTGNWIGGPVAGEGNFIVAGAGATAISLTQDADSNLLRGNSLGEGPSSTIPAFANGTGIGIGGNVSGTVIGGGGAAANEISNSTGVGIAISSASATGNLVTRNSIHDNGGLGIDLGPAGVTPNDAGDGDVGANNLQNFPVVASAVNVCGSGVTSIAGTVDTPAPDTGIVELFASPAADPSGNGEGQTFLGQIIPAFNGSFATVLPLQAVGTKVTSTFSTATGDTSEFSGAATVVATPFAPTNLDAEVVAGPAVQLTWVDSASDETGFRIERRAAGGAFALLANVAANTISFSDPGPFALGTMYYYRVRAENACQSPWSNIASALVPAATTPFCRMRATHHEGAANSHAEAAGPGQFGLTWRETDDDAASILYARLDATGATVAGPVVVRASTERTIGQMLAWNGSRWGMVWYERLGDRFGLFFETFDLSGNLLTGPIPVSEAAGWPTVNQLLKPGFGWDGQGWGIAWPDVRNGTTEVFYAHIAADGVTKDAGDLLINDNGSSATAPRLAWNGAEYGIVWYDFRTLTRQIYFRRFARDGTFAGPSGAVTTTATLSFELADLRWDGVSEFGLAWIDDRDGIPGLFFMRVSATGAPLSAETRISDSAALGVQNFQMVLRRLATKWGVAVEDLRDGDLSGVEIRLAFATLAGAKLGADVLVSSPLDIYFADGPALAWDGTRMLAAWHDAGTVPDSLEIHAQVVDEAGSPGVNPRRVVTSGHVPGAMFGFSVLERLSSGFAVAWVDLRDGRNENEIYLRLFDGSGNPVTGEIAAPDLPVSSSGGHLASAWSGEVLAILWQDAATGQPTLGFFDAAGIKLRPDVVVPMVATGQPSDLLWTGEHFLVAWEKGGNPNGNELHVAAYLPDGTLAGGPHQISVAAGSSRQPSLAGAGSLAVVWRDTRDGNGEIYAAALDRFGARIGPEIRLTNEATDQNRPALSWNGLQFGLAWADARTGQQEVRFRRLAADATATGSEIQLSGNFGGRPAVATDGSGWGVAFFGFMTDPGPGGPQLVRVDASGAAVGTERLAIHSAGGVTAIVWDGARYVVAAVDIQYFAGEVSLKSSACILDTTPPFCPTGLSAGVVGHDVTLSWTPAIDSDFAVERQFVVRDGSRMAAVLPVASIYLDREVDPGLYTYSVGALNQGYLEAPACPTLQVNVAIFEDGFESGTTSAWSLASPP